MLRHDAKPFKTFFFPASDFAFPSNPNGQEQAYITKYIELAHFTVERHLHFESLPADIG
jgi:hypothetical protein